MGAKRYSRQFKEEAIKLVQDEGLTVRQAAEDLGVSVWTLRSWLKQAKPAAGKMTRGTDSLSTEEELKKLRDENRRLRMEREILKKATAFFARHQS